MIGSASAAIVCDNDGNCWHVKDRYDYPPTAGVVVHEDNWKWDDHDHDKYRWHEHEGRGAMVPGLHFNQQEGRPSRRPSYFTRAD